MFGNASLMSALYLSAAVLSEVARRTWGTRWSERASLAFESLPARALELVGLLAPLRRQYAYGALSEVWVRVIFGLTSVAIIFAMAAAVGAGMWALRVLWERKTGLSG
ncbi:MAG: hypothetical protein HYZ28_20965 [Myxococcales bacterium]|nr:hypothetical protein [Myxococcales bacterium]